MRGIFGFGHWNKRVKYLRQFTRVNTWTWLFTSNLRDVDYIGMWNWYGYIYLMDPIIYWDQNETSEYSISYKINDKL